MAPETHDQPEHTIVVRSSSDRRNRKVTPAAFRQRVRKYPGADATRSVLCGGTRFNLFLERAVNGVQNALLLIFRTRY